MSQIAKLFIKKKKRTALVVVCSAFVKLELQVLDVHITMAPIFYCL